jgi:hypothetical protein
MITKMILAKIKYQPNVKTFVLECENLIEQKQK